MRNLNFFGLVIFFLLFSCSSKKNVVYMQDIENMKEISLISNEYKINPGDILKISLLNESIPTDNVFNDSQRVNTTNRETLIFDGYVVDKNGNINFPSVGEINVKNMSTKDLEYFIQNSLISSDTFTSIFVNVKVINWNYTVIGEVNNPGRYYFDDNQFNLLDAIGKAGDLTINGDRNIKILRNIDDNLSVFHIDLKKTDFLTSPAFIISSGDIIIVNPNTNRAKNAGIIGNSGTLLSLLSFLLTSFILLANN